MEIFDPWGAGGVARGWWSVAEEKENEEERGGIGFGGAAAEVVGGSRGTFGVRGTWGEGCSSSLLALVRERRKWRFPLLMMSESLLAFGKIKSET